MAALVRTRGSGPVRGAAIGDHSCGNMQVQTPVGRLGGEQCLDRELSEQGQNMCLLVGAAGAGLLRRDARQRRVVRA